MPKIGYWEKVSPFEWRNDNGSNISIRREQRSSSCKPYYVYTIMLNANGFSQRIGQKYNKNLADNLAVAFMKKNPGVQRP